ncbi:SufE family protein [Avibacterium paragallinarum]|uniref:SufE family protein n=1 Tax=Avibacterium paragallinarum TaxID=728 RepID=A0AAE5TLU6_AVIPA|nr:SufE family protein [Avibacterium paragallinarum]MEE3608059.1 SufE family protein [Avibacterium paragallinarum]MEE3621011.1 SufE family protein [Avibacterium paragallinarum]MEE3668261.1 SufE family protein [Avibacterium paragallinarum]MEE3680540.1 SufE family protein [Avibacterium paragallinarum]MEE4385606.1 SufE family protein [Avibacterium paragallinarum]
MRTQIKNAPSWEERYRLLIQSGKNLPRPDEQQLTQMQPISGCEANVWFKIEPQNDRTFHFHAFSEARIINGLLWLLLQEINGKTAEQLQQFDLTAYFSDLGIAQRLSSTRLNGLKQIERLVQNLANCAN